MIWLWGALWRYAAGVMLTLTPLTAVFLIGWMQARAAHTVRRRWARAGGGPTPILETPSSLRAWPAAIFRTALSSIRVLVPIFVVLAPASALSLFSWWAGWENSFNKGYEQAWVGPTLALLGIAYFSVAMLYLPLAEARHAITRSWTAFFGLNFIFRLAASSWLSLVLLAAAFLFAGTIVALLKVIPLGIGNSGWTEEQLSAFAGQYPLICAAVLFPLFAGLRILAARIYAAGVLRLAQRGAVLATEEEAALMQAGVSLSPPQENRSLRLVARPFAYAASAAGVGAAFASWVAFAIVLGAGQFLVHDWWGWINHPLLQVPAVVSIFRS